MPRISADEYLNRLDCLQAEVAGAGLDLFLVSSFDNIYYLTGAGFEPLERPFFLLVTPTGGGEPTLLVPRLDAEHMKKALSIQIKRIHTYWDHPALEGRRWADVLRDLTGKAPRVGVEPSLKLDMAEELRDLSPSVAPLIEKLRLVKSPGEIAMIRTAAHYSDRAVQQLLAASYRGATVAEGFTRTSSITRSIIRESANWDPLTTRVLMATWAAPRSAQPHSVPALWDRLRAGPHVALAFLRVNGYAAESERTYFTARPNPEMQRAFRAMEEGRSIALGMIRPGVACREIDAAVSTFLKVEGYSGEECRLHRTGHGIGLGNHEAPWVAEGSTDILAENMIISIEPGIYLHGDTAGGFRHSDTVLVTRDGCECLTHLPTDIHSLTIRALKPVTRMRGAMVRRALRPKTTAGAGAQRHDSLAQPATNDPERVQGPSRMRGRIKTLGGLIGAVFAAFIGTILWNLLSYHSKQVHVNEVDAVEPLRGFDDRLARAIRFRTVATAADGAGEAATFQEFHEFLKTSFPRVHARLDREVHGGHSLLYRWKGADPSREPILLMSHIDVVPVESGTEASWTRPPFSGDLADGFIWGRGALDVKCGALGLLEAAERLLEDGFRPASDVYFALGHDEEVGGNKGNRRLAEILRSRGVHFRFVLDEGGGLTEGIIDGISGLVAFVGVAEKGYATIRLKAQTDGGHSSMPPPHTAVGMIATVVARLESNPFPARIDGATAAMLDYLGPEMPWHRRAALANRWLTGGLIARQFAAKPSMNALIRTTMAATISRGGDTANVLPKQAETVVNLRLLPGDTSESALQRIQNEVKRLGFDEKTVMCSMEPAPSEPSAISSTASDGFRTLQRTIAEIYRGTVVAPGLSMVATDSHHYAPIASDIYRFLPLRLTADDLKRIHGVDERIGIKTYADLIGFLARLIENSSTPRARNAPERFSLQ